MEKTIIGHSAALAFARQVVVFQQHAVEDTTKRACLRCVVCHQPFAFGAGEAALVLRHTAYGYDFVHDGSCLTTAREMLFVQPGYDCAAFGQDQERRRILAVIPARGWSAVVAAPDRTRAGANVRFEPLHSWVLVENRDGSQRVEGLVRGEEWVDEPGGAEFPEATRGSRGWLGYAAPGDAADHARLEM